ncbi:hypothetical protein HY450_02965 [Candidatus Pacearchaeota archaeon]|nr:hypothetical protein [Candidatus Pacearchaeota archaeon]
MKKINLVFISIIALELVVMATGYYFLANNCGLACDSPNFLNPFGLGEESRCRTCSRVPHQIFYPAADLFILTVVLYLVHLFRRNKK